MPRIPIPVYQQRVAPSGLGPSPHAVGAKVDGSAAAALTDLGRSSQGLGVATAAAEERERVQAEIRRKELDRQDELDADVWVSDSMSKARISWEENLTQRKSTVPPGAKDFTPKVIEDFDKFADATMEGAPTPKSRAKLALSLNQLRTEVATKAIGFQAKAHEDWRTDTITQSINTSATLLTMDPGQYAPVREEQRRLIESMDVNPVIRSKLLEQAERSFSVAAVTGMIRVNPQATYDQLVGIAPRDYSKTEITPGVSGPRGIRNNNPGNLVKSGVKWEGEADGADPKYTSFATPEHGLRAMAVNLITYQEKHGLNTPEAIVRRWAPASENGERETSAYVAAVANAVKAKPGEQIDLRKPSVLKAVMRAMVAQENGRDPYSDAQVARGANAALGTEKLDKPTSTVRPYLPDAAALVDGKTGNPAVDSLPIADRFHLIQQAQAAVQRGQADEKSQLVRRQHDAASMAADGIRDPQPLGADAFVRAYGQREGPIQFENYQRTQSLATDVNAVSTMTPDQRIAMLERSSPALVAGQPGYEQERQRYNTRVQAVERVRKEEIDDPIRTAIARGIGGAKPVDFSSADAMKGELAKRVGTAEVMATQYQTPYQLLSKTEARQLSAVLAVAPTSGKVETLKAIRDAVRDPVAYRQILGQIAPDSPVTAAAGVIADKQNPLVITRTFAQDQVFRQGDVAGVILEGEAILNKSKGAKAEDGKGKGFAMPPEKDIRGAFVNYVGKAFAGDPHGEEIAYQAYRAYYAGDAAREGDITGEWNGDRGEKAARLVTGGVSDFNARGKVIMPWGMPEGQFRNEVAQEWGKAVKANGWEKTLTGSLPQYGLQSSGDSRYLVRNGTGYLLGKNGKPVELDLTPPAWTRLKPPGG